MLGREVAFPGEFGAKKNKTKDHKRGPKIVDLNFGDKKITTKEWQLQEAFQGSYRCNNPLEF